MWLINLDKSPFIWNKLEITQEVPSVRVYHAASVCNTGSANGMMIIFGGRTSDSSALNDTWGLRRHRDGRWDWVKAPYKHQAELPIHRYQHSTLFIGSLMFVMGGRSNQVGENLPLEVYDTENSDWSKFNPVHRFRHTLWYYEEFLYIHGGFEQDQPNIPTDTLLKLDIGRLLLQYPQLSNSYQSFLAKEKSASSFLSKESAIIQTNTPYNK